MERITANAIGRLRYETLQGRRYAVVPMRMIVPGVLNGSQGALLYREQEIRESVDTWNGWNGLPIVNYHPQQNGSFVSARSPDILEKYQVGTVFNATATPALDAEAWIDIEAANRIDDRIMQAVENGKPMELSTGLFTEREAAVDGAVFNGQRYDYVAKRFQPDHLALLPDQQGACSLKDGCGLLINETPEGGEALETTTVANEGRPMATKELVDQLIANCACYEESDRDAVANFSDEQINRILKTNQDREAIVNEAAAALSQGVEVDGKKFVFNGTDWVQEQPAEPEAPQDAQAWLATAPAEIRSAVQNAINLEAKEKAKLIDQLTANLGDGQAAAKEFYGAKSLEELQTLASFQPAQPRQPQTATSFFGAGGGGGQPVANKSEPLPLPKMWDTKKEGN